MTKNPKFNRNLLSLEDLEFLHDIRHKDVVKFSNESVRLFVRGFLCEHRLHALKFTPRGRFAARYVGVGATVQVSQDYHIPYMRGEVGTVISICDNNIDADGIDEYGYTIHRAKPATTVSVKFPNRVGQTWCFHRPEDLYGKIETLQVDREKQYDYFRFK